MPEAVAGLTGPAAGPPAANVLLARVAALWGRLSPAARGEVLNAARSAAGRGRPPPGPAR